MGAWLDTPISDLSCVLGWCMATSLFLLLVSAFGGIGQSDTYESVFSTWAIAHGLTSCAFPRGYNITAPLYPLLSGGVAALAHIGHSVPFPQRSAMGPHCEQGFVAINFWSLQSGAIYRTVQIGFLGWFALLGGAVGLLRATGRGRRRWEPMTLAVLACVPTVGACLQSTFHPEDLLALGLALAAVATAIRDRWGWSGLLIGLAVMSQQYTTLVAVPLFFLAPRGRRVTYSATAGLVVAAVGGTLMAVTSGGAVRAVFLGTGDSRGIGGAVVSGLHLHGAPLVLLSRVTPLVISALLAIWVVRLLGERARGSAAMLALITCSLGLRLVFEQQIFEYYFMGLMVGLVLLDVVAARLRGALVAWILAVSTVDVRQIYIANHQADFVRLCVLAVAAGALAWKLLLGNRNWQAVPWVALIACTFASWPNVDPFGVPAMWVWQMVLVGWGMTLSVTALVRVVRAGMATAPSRWEGRSGPTRLTPASFRPTYPLSGTRNWYKTTQEHPV